MSSILDDPLYNVIENGIKRDIDVVIENGRWRAAVMLIYAGMDFMAFLDMEAGQVEVTRADFVRWADRYMRFPCKEQVSGEDFYGARCAMLHSYGTDSRMSRAGKCRQIGYMDQSVPEVRFDAKVDADLVLVSIRALKKAFFDGVNEFLIYAYATPAKKAVVDPRLAQRIHAFNMAEGDDGLSGDS